MTRTCHCGVLLTETERHYYGVECEECAGKNIGARYTGVDMAGPDPDHSAIAMTYAPSAAAKPDPRDEALRVALKHMTRAHDACADPRRPRQHVGEILDTGITQINALLGQEADHD